jgi:hypothetical protein
MKDYFLSMAFEFVLDLLRDAASRTTNTIDDQVCDLIEENADEILTIARQKF